MRQKVLNALPTKCIRHPEATKEDSQIRSDPDSAPETAWRISHRSSDDGCVRKSASVREKFNVCCLVVLRNRSDASVKRASEQRSCKETESSQLDHYH